MRLCVLKYDHFENIHRLPKEIPPVEGAPNFRQVRVASRDELLEQTLTTDLFLPLKVPGYLVFGTGQPTREGFRHALERIFGETDATGILWTNMRQVRICQ